MKILKSYVKLILSACLCLCAFLYVFSFKASAADFVESYTTPINDCDVIVYATAGGTVKCTKATSGFLMGTGTRNYEAIPEKGYKFEKWDYDLYLHKRTIFGSGEENIGNKKDFWGRYPFSQKDNKKLPIDIKKEVIQLNRLNSHGEFFIHSNNFSRLIYEITANFTKV